LCNHGIYCRGLFTPIIHTVYDVLYVKSAVVFMLVWHWRVLKIQTACPSVGSRRAEQGSRKF